MLLNLILFCYCSLAFYIAANNYATDGNDRNQINDQYSIYTDKLKAATDARIIETSASSKKTQLDSLISSCEMLGTDLDAVIVPNVTYYDEMYASEAECNQRVDMLNTTLQQLRANATIRTLGDGYCQLNSDVGSDTSVLYYYRRAIVNGFDFYYYVFPSSTAVATNGTVVFLENCSPPIWNGPPQRQGYKSGIVGDGVLIVDIDVNRLNITLSSGYRTVQLSDFQIWSRGM